MTKENRTGFWWLQMPYKFFDMHELMYLRSLREGNEKVRIFTEMTVESVKYNGHMRFSDDIPYTPALLAPIVHTTEELLEEALKDFEDIGLIQILENLTIHIPMVASMVGFQTKEARKIQQWRRKKEVAENEKGNKCNEDVKSCNEVVVQSHININSHIRLIDNYYIAICSQFSDLQTQRILKANQKRLVDRIRKNTANEYISDYQAYIQTSINNFLSTYDGELDTNMRTQKRFTKEEIELAQFDWVSGLGDE